MACKAAERTEPPNGLSASTVALSAARIRAEAEANPYSQAWDFEPAKRLEQQLEAKLPGERCEIVTGGELNPAVVSNDRPDYANTLTRPNRVNAAASRERLELLNNSGALDAGMDLAETVGAANTVEKMLSHQMAVAHRTAMKLSEHVNAATTRLNAVDANARDRATVEVSRLAGSMTRAMLAFQNGAMTLERLRSGGKQTHVVQYVVVKDGGQAMVNGKIQAKTRGGKRNGGRPAK